MERNSEGQKRAQIETCKRKTNSRKLVQGNNDRKVSNYACRYTDKRTRRHSEGGQTVLKVRVIGMMVNLEYKRIKMAEEM